MKSIFISGGCNSVYNGLDVCQFEENQHLIAFPCSNQILVYDIKKLKIIYSYSIFNKRVNYVRFLNATTLVAADGEGKIAIFNDSQVLYEAKLNESIQLFKVIGQYIIALSIDGLVTVLNLELKELSKLEFGNNVMENIDAIEFDKHTFVALSGVDTQIHLYILENNQLQYKASVKGHQRSLNHLQFHLKNQEYLQLASASKDTYTRIWSIYKINEVEAKTKSFRIEQQLYSFKLETILQGHIEEVSTVNWFDENTILSGSFDYNVIIWKQDKDTGLWLSVSRLGQTSGNKNQIFGLQTSFDKQYIICYTLTGAIYIWKQEQDNWVEQPVVTGHYAEVTDLDFKDYVLTCSSDQTSRIFTKWIKNDTYHEISRPQIHGYDLNAIKQIGNQIISGGDEKILRMFNPSPFTINQLNYLNEQNINSSVFLNQNIPSQIVTYNNRQFNEFKLATEGIQQALGLMNVQMQFEDEEDENVKNNEVEVNLEIKYGQPPNDALLAKKSLWPETNKLYGHGYAIQAIAIHQNIAASSSVAITSKAAEIIIWDTNTFKIKQLLPCHNFTVVQLVFSRSGKYLISVSKDRCLGVFVKQDDDTYQILSKSQPCSRIVYTCAFNNDESLIFTGSRDKKFRIYNTTEASVPIKEIEFQDEITAIDSVLLNNKQIVAVAYGQGQLETFELTQTLELNLLSSVDKYHKHSKTINRIKFNNDLLASCSDDHTVRIYQI
ncbi:unnamed protein product (macronuclear) [Paramecium tetraurelia]|uniref:Elongator complex protein 2 n=1 Tax=Paramecium tetraurelia TaxID=5888 RepID=A0C7W0_PARTE|nr:uncharacterized protein GSPATT00036008001 [Paramecium tetraurelia]CAK66877.1 unnamed protein product [Paramecium tetraurelia]|eukprot:XP_001434274.1 hypothetical protein (macronuclear) [Paramecium tetraurelia strain d4-2]